MKKYINKNILKDKISRLYKKTFLIFPRMTARRKEKGGEMEGDGERNYTTRSLRCSGAAFNVIHFGEI